MRQSTPSLKTHMRQVFLSLNEGRGEVPQYKSVNPVIKLSNSNLLVPDFVTSQFGSHD